MDPPSHPFPFYPNTQPSSRLFPDDYPLHPFHHPHPHPDLYHHHHHYPQFNQYNRNPPPPPPPPSSTYFFPRHPLSPSPCHPHHHSLPPPAPLPLFDVSFSPDSDDRDRLPNFHWESRRHSGGDFRRPGHRFSDSFLEPDRRPLSPGDGDDHPFRRRVKDRIFRPPVRERLGHVTRIYHHENPNLKKKVGLPNSFGGKKFVPNSGKNPRKPLTLAKIGIFKKPESATAGSRDSDACVSRASAKKNNYIKAKRSVPSIEPKSMVVRAVAEDGEADKILEPCPDEKASILHHSLSAGDVGRDASCANCTNSGEMEIELGEFVIPSSVSAVIEENKEIFHASKVDFRESSTEIVDIVNVGDANEILSNGGEQSANLMLGTDTLTFVQSSNSLSDDKYDSMAVRAIAKDREAEMLSEPCSREKASLLVQSSHRELSVGNVGDLITLDAGKEASSENCCLDEMATELGEIVIPLCESVVREESKNFDGREEEIKVSPTEIVTRVDDASGLLSNAIEQSSNVELQSDSLTLPRNFDSFPDNKCDSVRCEGASELPSVSSNEQGMEVFSDGLAGIKCPDSSIVFMDVQISSTSLTAAKDLNPVDLNACCSYGDNGMGSEWKETPNSGKLQNLVVPSLDRDAVPTNPDSESISKPEADPEVDGLLDKIVLPPLPPTRKPTVTPAISKTSTRRTLPIFPPRGNFSFGTPKQKSSVPSTRDIKRARAWHREGNSHSSPSPSPVHESCSGSRPNELSREHQIQAASYIRKGNSLVRKASTTNALTQTRSNLKTSCGEEKHNALDAESSHRLLDRPKTPPLFNSKFQRSVSRVSEVNNREAAVATKLPDYRTTNLITCKSEGCSWDDEKLKTNVLKNRVTYVKRKANQLVASSRSEVSDSVKDKAHEVPKVPASVYYKSKNNQIIRNVGTLKSNEKQEDSLSLDSQRDTHLLPSLKYSRNFGKRKHNKVSEHPSKSSLVWTLSKESSDSKSKTNASLRYQFLPLFFPWKRSTYRRHSFNNFRVNSDKPSLSIIRKLQISRKRDTLYTKSKNGFSIRKSRVLSIGGSNLKWSKSIERRSKKASKEATLAVAATQKKKDRKVATVAGEHIFRIGTFKYKMDATKKTLIRISDEKSSGEAGAESGIATKKSYIPRRLVIGNNEYVRVGNGNKLVRDPKRFKRILANEKIRWSLHNARLRLAKKQQYCQFFTRFGKCRKENGKCPYIHDPDKIAVCTKFLKGVCCDTNCKLTHKVLPERMPDCSYFLQGLCINENCPYRHVNVNKDASVCEGFLRGYCSDGDKCCKRHTYVCPSFEIDGICPKGTACKLHHPKNLNRNRKRKRCKEQKNKGRYFGSSELLNGGELETSIGEDSIEVVGVESILCDGRYPESDYISLDGPQEVEDTRDLKRSRLYSLNSEVSELLFDDMGKLMKPIGIMNKITVYE